MIKKMKNNTENQFLIKRSYLTKDFNDLFERSFYPITSETHQLENAGKNFSITDTDFIFYPNRKFSSSFIYFLSDLESYFQDFIFIKGNEIVSTDFDRVNQNALILFIIYLVFVMRINGDYSNISAKSRLLISSLYLILKFDKFMACESDFRQYAKDILGEKFNQFCIRLHKTKYHFTNIHNKKDKLQDSIEKIMKYNLFKIQIIDKFDYKNIRKVDYSNFSSEPYLFAFLSENVSWMNEMISNHVSYLKTPTETISHDNRSSIMDYRDYVIRISYNLHNVTNQLYSCIQQNSLQDSLFKEPFEGIVLKEPFNEINEKQNSNNCAHVEAWDFHKFLKSMDIGEIYVRRIIDRRKSIQSAKRLQHIATPNKNLPSIKGYYKIKNQQENIIKTDLPEKSKENKELVTKQDAHTVTVPTATPIIHHTSLKMVKSITQQIYELEFQFKENWRSNPNKVVNFLFSTKDRQSNKNLKKMQSAILFLKDFVVRYETFSKIRKELKEKENNKT